MTARWDRLPDHMKDRVVKRRRSLPDVPLSWRCEGVGGCGATLTLTYRKMEQHVDSHGGTARIALDVATLTEPQQPEGDSDE